MDSKRSSPDNGIATVQSPDLLKKNSVDSVPERLGRRRWWRRGVLLMCWPLQKQLHQSEEGKQDAERDKERFLKRPFDRRAWSVKKNTTRDKEQDDQDYCKLWQPYLASHYATFLSAPLRLETFPKSLVQTNRHRATD